MRRAKIVCTLGPASSSPERLGELIDAGMDVARLNFSHGAQETHRKSLQILRHEAERRGRAVAALLDLQGPKIRVGKFESGEVDLARGARFTITTKPVVGNAERVSTTYQGITGDVHEGDRILLDDGFLTLRVAEVTDDEVRTVVEDGGLLRNNKGINLPNVAVSQPALTAKDKADLAFGMRLGVDYIALSFVRKPEDVLEARQLASVGGRHVPIIAKIEKPQAVECLDDIIEVSDGIMVARGDLGVEMGPEKVPMVQKEIIRKTNAAGKIVITATQMLESMIQHARPTRAEASDVANAILDGTDAVMLSGETAVGEHPVAVVRTMSRIVEEVERSSEFNSPFSERSLAQKVSANAIAHAAVIASREMGASLIAVMTESGGAARLISEHRPEARIVAFTTDEVTYRRLALHWGVLPLMIPSTVTFDETIERVEEGLRSHELLASGAPFVITAAVPVGAGETTNLLKVHRLP